MDLRKLHKLATEARDSAHVAYTIALRNRRCVTQDPRTHSAGDTQAAFETLVLANAVRDSIYEMLLTSIAKGSS